MLKTINIKKIRPNIKSETLLKKYLSSQPPNQLKYWIYSCWFSALKFGVAPALDHNSYQLFMRSTSDIENDQDKLSKHETANG